jgi:hypothetical protein
MGLAASGISVVGGKEGFPNATAGGEQPCIEAVAPRAMLSVHHRGT